VGVTVRVSRPSRSRVHRVWVSIFWLTPTRHRRDLGVAHGLRRVGCVRLGRPASAERAQGQDDPLVRDPFEQLATGASRRERVVLQLGCSPLPGCHPRHRSHVIPVGGLRTSQTAQAQSITPIVCVQNLYNLAHRHNDDLIDRLAAEGIAYVPFFPLGGFTPLQSSALSAVAGRLGTTPMSVAPAWLLQRSPNILLLAGTSNRAHLRENVAGAGLSLSPDDVAELDDISS